MAPGLLDMPEDVMSKIMEDIGTLTMMTLREVCHDLRNFIDDVKPAANWENIGIVVESDGSISVDFVCFDGVHHCTWYSKHEEGCSGDRIETGVLLKNEDFINVCMKNTEIMLRHQKAVLKKFEVFQHRQADVNEDLALEDHFERILKSRVHPLKVETFTTLNINQRGIMAILPFLDTNTLNTLQITMRDVKLEVDQLVKLDQWKNIQHLDLSSCWIDLEYIKHFTHFTTNNFEFKSTHCPDLVLIKNMYLQSTGFKTIFIKITGQYDSDEFDRSTKLMRDPYFNFDECSEKEEYSLLRTRWYYRIPATTKVVEITVHEISLAKLIDITFSKIDESEVPQGAVIQN